MSKLVSKFKVGDKVKLTGSNIITTVIEVHDCGVYNYYRLEFDRYTHKGEYYDRELELYTGELKELADKPKEYTIHNLMEFPEGTEFITSAKNKYRIYDGELSYCYDVNHSWSNSTLSLKEILNTKFMKFTKVEDLKLKPMTFEEAVKTGKKIKYKNKSYTLDKFYNVQDTFKILTSSMYASETVSEILLESTWYAEGVYE